MTTFTLKDVNTNQFVTVRVPHSSRCPIDSRLFYYSIGQFFNYGLQRCVMIGKVTERN